MKQAAPIGAGKSHQREKEKMKWIRLTDVGAVPHEELVRDKECDEDENHPEQDLGTPPAMKSRTSVDLLAFLYLVSSRR